MPFHLEILKRHSDPAPCSKSNKSYNGMSVRSGRHSDPDINYKGSTSSPAKGIMASKSTVSSSPSNHTHLRRSRAIRYRRLSSNGYVSANLDYFNTTPRRATHPNTSSPRKFRRGSFWLEDDADPWVQFRLKGLASVVPNGDDKPFMTSTDGDAPCYRLRSFSVTSKGVVNLGDFLRARSHSEASVSSEDLDQCFRSRRESAESTRSPVATVCNSRYKVLLLGAEDVGKTSLAAQFTTSDSLTVISDLQASVDGSTERTVSLIVDGEESEVTCEDPGDSSYELDDSIFCATNAFLVVYSISDRKSFDEAEKILDHIRDLKNRCTYIYPGTTNKAIILVANKVDLVRCRQVSSEEGRFLADRYEIKYVETSVGFNHNVDELLVGVVTQIRLQKATRDATFTEVSRHSSFSGKARGMMNRLLQKCELKTRSCDNLHVL